MHRGDHLGHGAHADEIGAQRPQHPILGARLEIGTGHRDVHAFTQHDLVIHRDLARELAQPGIIRRGHVREARTLGSDVRPDQRIIAEQVDVVGEEHEVAREPQRMHPARDVGDDQCLRAQRPEHPHRESDLLQRVALVAMEAALHDREFAFPHRAEQQAAGVRLDRRRRESGDLRIGDRGLGGGLQLVGERTKAGTQDHRDLWNDRGPRLNGADRLGHGDDGHFCPSRARSSARWRSSRARKPPTY